MASSTNIVSNTRKDFNWQGHVSQRGCFGNYAMPCVMVSNTRKDFKQGLASWTRSLCRDGTRCTRLVPRGPSDSEATLSLRLESLSFRVLWLLSSFCFFGRRGWGGLPLPLFVVYFLFLLVFGEREGGGGNRKADGMLEVNKFHTHTHI